MPHASAVADIQGTYGTLFLGLIISVALYGMTIIQGWIYFLHNRRRDSRALKVFVAVVIGFDTLHTVLCTYGVYWRLVLNFGNVASLGLDMWATNTQSVINMVIGYLVQLFYARRVYLMSKNIIIPLIVVVLGALRFAMGFLFTVRAFQLKEYSRYGSLVWVTVVAMSAAAVIDILIASSMSWYLYHKKTGFTRTDSLITTLMTYTINTGLITSILATLTLIFFIIVPTTSLIWQAFFWVSGKCYVNSLLAMLNSRDYLRERSNNVDSNDFSLTPARASSLRFKPRPQPGPTAVTVNVHQATAIHLEGETHDDYVEPSTPESVKHVRNLHPVED